jgi:hypothetical protein
MFPHTRSNTLLISQGAANIFRLVLDVSVKNPAGTPRSMCCTSMQLAVEGNMCIYCWWKWLSPDMFSRILSMAYVPPQGLKSKSALQRLLHHGSINSPALFACGIGFDCLMNLARNVSLLSLWSSALATESSHELRSDSPGELPSVCWFCIITIPLICFSVE